MAGTGGGGDGRVKTIFPIRSGVISPSGHRSIPIVTRSISIPKHGLVNHGTVVNRSHDNVY